MLGFTLAFNDLGVERQQAFAASQQSQVLKPKTKQAGDLSGSAAVSLISVMGHSLGLLGSRAAAAVMLHIRLDMLGEKISGSVQGGGLAGDP